MELSQLRYFCDVAETEHVTKSSLRLNVVQPTLTRSIHRLENELGVSLFVRDGRNIRLTTEGDFFYKKISPLLTSMNDAIDELHRFSEDQRNTVHISLLSASNVVVDAIAKFKENNTAVHFEISQEKQRSDSDMYIDTLLPYRPSPTESSAIDATFFTETIGIAVPIDSSYGPTVSLNELSHESFICLAGSRRFRVLCDHLCASEGFFPTIGFESDNPAVVKKMIGLGLGVGFWPEYSWGSLDESGARWIPLTNPSFERTISIKLNRSANRNESSLGFHNSLLDFMGQIGLRRIA